MFISHFFSENIVGTQRIKHLYNFLKKRGNNVEIFCNNSYESKLNFSLAIIKKIYRSKAKLVFVSCGPFYYLLASVIASVIFKKKLIIDIRDPLSFNVKILVSKISITTIKRKLFKKYYQILENISYKYSNYYIVCTLGMYCKYAELFKNVEKLLFIPNGYNFTPENQNIDYTNKDIEKYICIGKFFEYSYIQANKIIDMILERQKKNGKKVYIHFYGSEEVFIYKLKNDLSKYSYIYIEHFPRIEYEKVIKILPEYDCGIIVIRNEDFDYGTKIYDFIGKGIPVLDTFDHKKNFYNMFSKYLVSIDGVFEHYIPDKSFNRDEIWAKNEWIFKN